MRYLLDANALLDLIKKRKKIIFGQYILDLTIYEIGNAIWKETKLFKNLTKEEAIGFMSSLMNIIEKLNIINVGDDAPSIMEIAIEEGLTFYDAAYLYYAQKNSLTLVTDDKKLYNAAKNKIRVIYTAELIKD